MTPFAFRVLVFGTFSIVVLASLFVLVRGEIEARRQIGLQPFGSEPSELSLSRRWGVTRLSFLNISAIAVGFFYGLSLRLYVGLKWQNSSDSGTITIAFLVLGPLVIGFLSIYPVERTTPISTLRWIFQPWIPVWLICAATAALLWEGTICIIMLLPIALILSTIGGVLGGLLARFVKPRSRTVVCLAALPFLAAPAETYLHPPTSIRTVENTVSIRATPDTVWQEIQSVPPIEPSELRPTWTHAIGFPRPREARLSRPGVGGVRTATFERGLTFYETVTDWQPARQLSFTIKADTDHIPPTTLDEHVTIGGPYFDVLDGTYRIEPHKDGTVLLHLTSHQRLTTDVNSYASLWTEAIMSDLQKSILQVIQHRCEHTASLNHSTN